MTPSDTVLSCRYTDTTISPADARKILLLLRPVYKRAQCVLPSVAEFCSMNCLGESYQNLGEMIECDLYGVLYAWANELEEVKEISGEAGFQEAVKHAEWLIYMGKDNLFLLETWGCIPEGTINKLLTDTCFPSNFPDILPNEE